jgi:hypothetical protein
MQPDWGFFEHDKIDGKPKKQEKEKPKHKRHISQPIDLLFRLLVTERCPLPSLQLWWREKRKSRHFRSDRLLCFVVFS